MCRKFSFYGKIIDTYQSNYRLFNGITIRLKESQESSGILAHYEFKFLSLPGIFSLEVTNTLGTAEFESEQDLFFFERNYSVSKKLLAYYLSAYVL